MIYIGGKAISTSGQPPSLLQVSLFPDNDYDGAAIPVVVIKKMQRHAQFRTVVVNMKATTGIH